MHLDELVSKNLELYNIIKNMPKQIRENCNVKKIPAKTIIQRKDDVLDTFSIICKGTVKIINEFENGNSYIIEKNDAIDFIGEVTALAGKVNTSVTIEAITDCVIIQLTLQDFYQWIKQDNDFLLLLSRRVANKLYNSSYTKGVELFYPAIHLMISFLVNYKAPKVNENIHIHMTRQEISEKLGVTVRTINRSIKKLKDKNLITINKGKIEINEKQYKILKESLVDRKYL